VGRVVETKKIDLVIDALEIMNKKFGNFKFVIVGNGTAYKGLVKKAEASKLSDKIIFTGEIKDREFLKGFYLRADLFVFPSVFDTASLVPIEAATFSLPTLLIKDSPTRRNNSR
jgi:glycosyltransferase involved in cell wall biosynthesis